MTAAPKWAAMAIGSTRGVSPRSFTTASRSHMRLVFSRAMAGGVLAASVLMFAADDAAGQPAKPVPGGGGLKPPVGGGGVVDPAQISGGVNPLQPAGALKPPPGG